MKRKNRRFRKKGNFDLGDQESVQNNSETTNAQESEIQRKILGICKLRAIRFRIYGWQSRNTHGGGNAGFDGW